MIKVLIADDHSVVRTGLSSMLSFERDIKIVGEAENGQEAIELIAKHKPDVVIMDLMMPVMNGIKATAAAKLIQPEIKVLILTTYSSADDIRQAIKVGATSAIMKTASNDTLIDTIRKTAAGVNVLSEEVKALLASEKDIPVLTIRQREILQLVMKGLTNKSIAASFNITQSCVKQHMRTIFSKLGAISRSDAITIALRKHLLKI